MWGTWSLQVLLCFSASFEGIMLQIQLTSLLVEDQDCALRFYTEVLGFVKKTEIPMGDVKWLTVVSPKAPNGVELTLEPTAFGPAKVYQKALYDAGIPQTAFAVDNIEQEYQRLLGLGVKFRGDPAKVGEVTLVLLEDTCGNLIQLYQPSE